MGGRRVLGLAAIVASLVLGCAGPAPFQPQPVVPSFEFGYSNGTKLDIAIAINGQVVVVAAPGQGAPQVDVPMPSLPWHVEARTASGRVLGSFDLLDGQATCEPVGDAVRCSGGLLRVDLSCGRLDIWAGVRPSGPMPGPGVPGDCQP